MPPRPSERKTDTRERILRAARELLRSAGPEGLSLREVARSVGIAAPSIYEHFDGKDALVEALTLDTRSRLRHALERSVEAAPEEALLAIGLAYVRFALSDPDGFRLLFLQRGSGRASLEQAVPEASPYSVVLRAVSDAALARRVRARSTTEVEHIAYGLWALAHGIAVLRLTHLAGMQADFEAADRAAFVAYLAGLHHGS
ncbi:MAG: TetR/AcrR family transcriptional regulator [Polyangiales bacterium]